MVVTTLLCYAPKDVSLVDQFKSHLSLFERRGLISLWDYSHMNPGVMQKQEIDIHFDEAQMILLCISPMFLAGYEEEIQRAIKRYERKEAHVIPILFRPVRRKESPIDKLQVLPDRAKPITKWKDRDEGFENVADGISKVVDQWNLHSLSVSIAERRALMANFDQFTEAVKLQMQPLVRALATATTLQQLSRCIPNGVTFADLVVGWQTLSHASTLEENQVRHAVALHVAN